MELKYLCSKYNYMQKIKYYLNLLNSRNTYKSIVISPGFILSPTSFNYLSDNFATVAY